MILFIHQTILFILSKTQFPVLGLRRAGVPAERPGWLLFMLGISGMSTSSLLSVSSCVTFTST